MKKQPLNRYTSLPILLDILMQKKLTLLDPKNWDDKNDYSYLEFYKNALGLKSLLALCFAECGETYEIWKVFSGDSCGVCIEFDKDLLLPHFGGVKGIRSGSVEYLTREKLKNKDSQDFDKLPFMKRRAFSNEKEFRFIYQDKDQIISSKYVNIDIISISKIIFNPWIPISVYDSIKGLIKKIDGCEKIRIRRTTLLDNEEWKNRGEQIASSYSNAHEVK